MVKILKKQEKNASYKAHCCIILVLLIVMLTSISFISGAEFDNRKSFDPKIGDYGKVTIKDWFGLLNLIELELKTNTEKCSNNCKAELDIQLFQKTNVIQDIRFIDLKTNKETIIKSYQILVNGKKYNLGDEINKEIYSVELLGELKPFQEVDWQIKTNGYWIEEWAVWTSELNDELIAYYPFDEGTGTRTNNSIDSTRYFGNLVNTPTWNTTSFIGTGLEFSRANSEYVNVTSGLPWGNNFTIQLWLRNDAITELYYRIFSAATPSSVTAFAHFDNAGNDIDFSVDAGNTIVSKTIDEAGWVDGRWHQVIFMNNGTHESIWINGTIKRSLAVVANVTGNRFVIGASENGANSFDGGIDEVGIWKRSLTPTEITQLYNSGDGISYGIVDTEVSLINPNNDTSLGLSIVNFTASIFPISTGELNNATIYVYNSIGNLINQTTKIITGSSINYTSFNISNLDAGVLTWNVLGCSSHATSTSCEWADNNYTLNYGITYNSITYTSSVVEGSINSFTANITYNSVDWNTITGTLVYNNTNYSGTKSGTGDNLLFTSNAPAPNVNSAQNVSFYWRMGLTDVSGTTYLTSSSYNQTVSPINMSLCGYPHTVPFLNFTFYNERTFSKINGSIDLSFNYRQTDSTTSNLFSYKNTSETENSFAFCMNPADQTYTINSILSYYADGYAQRYYNFKGIDFTNTTTNISLYLLPTANSTSFLVQVQDSNYQPVSDAEVYMQIYRTDISSWETVEIATTDTDGETVQHIYTEDSIYRFKIYDDGTLLHTTSGSIISCPSAPCTVTITLPGDLTTVTAPFGTIGSLETSLTYDSATEVITYVYTDTSGNFSRGRLYVIRKSPGELDISALCNTTSSSSSAVLTCDLTNQENGTYIATGYITRTGESELAVERKVINFVSDIVGIIGLDGVLWSVFLLIGILMLGVYRPSLGIIFGAVGVFLMSLLQLMEITFTAIVAIVGVAIILLIEVRKQ